MSTPLDEYPLKEDFNQSNSCFEDRRPATYSISSLCSKPLSISASAKS